MAPISPEQAQRLRAIFAQRSEVGAARMRFLGLSAVREALGDRWPARRERVLEIARNVLRSRLTEDEDVLLDGGEGFLIVFGALEAEAAEQKTIAISQELQQRVLAELEELRGLLTIDAHAASVTLDSLLSQAPRWIPPHERPEAPAAPTAEQPVAPPFPVQFVPAWSVPTNSLHTFFVRPAPSEDPWLMHRGNAESLAERSRAAAADFVLLEVALAELRRLRKAGKRRLLVPALCASSFSKTELHSGLIGPLRRLDRDLNALLHIEVLEKRLGATGHDVHSAAHVLHAHCRELALRTHLEDRALRRAREAGYAAVGVDLADYGDVGENALLAHIAAFAGRARSDKLSCYALGVATRPQAMALVSEGFALIEGPAIAPPAHDAEQVSRFTAQDLFRSLRPPDQAARA